MTAIDALAIADSGLSNVNQAIGVLSHNIANASSPGYVREVSNQTAMTAGGIQMGIATGAATRAIDVPLQTRLLIQNAAAGSANLTSQSLSQLDTAYGQTGSSTDLSSLLGNLETAFSTLENDPSVAAQQYQVVTQAQTLTSQINTVADTIGTLRQDAQNSIVSGVDTLNKDLGLIGTLNTQIVQLKAQGQSTADLENQRDAALSDASSQVELRSMVKPDGEMVVFTTSGLQLSTDPNAPSLSVSAAQTGPSATYPGGLPGIMLGTLDVTSQFANSGAIGAAITLRDSTLPEFQGELDEFSETLTTRFSEQGLTLFSDPSGNVPASTGTPRQANYVGFSNIIQVNPAVSADPSLVRDGTNTITGTTGGATAFTPNPTGGPTGFTDLITRVLQYSLGDEVASGVAQPTPDLSDMGPTGTLNGALSTTGQLSNFAAALVAHQTGAAGTAASQATAATDVQTALTQSLSNESGVDLDTELSNMVTLQNAYAANARVITTLQSMWTALFQSVQTT